MATADELRDAWTGWLEMMCKVPGARGWTIPDGDADCRQPGVVFSALDASGVIMNLAYDMGRDLWEDDEEISNENWANAMMQYAFEVIMKWRPARFVPKKARNSPCPHCGHRDNLPTTLWQNLKRGFNE